MMKSGTIAEAKRSKLVQMKIDIAKIMSNKKPVFVAIPVKVAVLADSYPRMPARSRRTREITGLLDSLNLTFIQLKPPYALK